MKIIIFLLIFCPLALLCQVFCNGSLSGVIIGNGVFWNKYEIGNNTDVHAVLTFFNFSSGVNFSSRYKPTFNIFGGIGLFNLFQFQIVCNLQNSHEKLFRFRSEIPIFNNDILWKDSGDKILTRINLQLYFEQNIDDNHQKKFGIGAGFLIL